jgi:hypothetical protein
MRRLPIVLPLLLVLAPLAACGTTHETTVVARPGTTVVVPNDNGHTKVITTPAE